MNYALRFASLPLFALAVVLHPIAAEGNTPEAVPAEECDVVPLSESQLVDYVTLGGEPEPFDDALLASAEPANEVTSAEIVALVRESVACTNANLPMAALALFSPHYLAARFSGDGVDDLGHLLAAITREPNPALEVDRLVLIEVAQPLLLNDGRVIATISTSNAHAEFTDRLLFIDIDGAWRIDAVIELQTDATPVAVS